MSGEPETTGGSAAREASRLPIEGLTAIELAAALDGETLVIDLRDATHGPGVPEIPGAIVASLQGLVAWADGDDSNRPGGFGQQRRIVVFSDEDAAAAHAALMLRERGYGLAAYLIGGLASWRKEETRTSTSVDVGETTRRKR